MLKFWHQSLQEFLASQSLAWMKDGEAGDEDWWPLVKKHLSDSHWWETIALLPSLLHDGGFNRVDSLLNRLLTLGEGDPTLEMKGRIVDTTLRLLESMTDQYQPTLEIKNRLQLLIHTVSNRPMMGSTYLRESPFLAAEAIGKFDDPHSSQDNLLPVPHTNWLLGKFLVTVFEYQQFVKDGGYKNPTWWDEGWPQQWEGPSGWAYQLIQPYRPVTGVSWFEAMAYCRWLSDQRKMDNLLFRLPDEELWEKAATANGCEYPWGNEEPSNDFANFNDNMGSPTPVGLYPAGNGPYGHCDLAGNVWEWQRNLYANKNGTNTPLDHIDIDGSTAFPLRGGAWHSSAIYLRSSFREWNNARSQDRFAGFRLAAIKNPFVPVWNETPKPC